MKIETIKDKLENDILSGVYKMGERLSEENIAREFNVSRTPIRETFRLLASSGLIELIPRRGAFVKDLSIASIIERFEVMAELEALCAKLASERANDEQLKEISSANQACLNEIKKNDHNQYYFENHKFHFAIYKASGNAFLTDEAKRLHKHLQPYRRAQLQIRNRLSQSNDEHQGILLAIKEGRPDDAARIARDHILIQGEKVGQLIAALSSVTKP